MKTLLKTAYLDSIKLSLIILELNLRNIYSRYLFNKISLTFNSKKMEIFYSRNVVSFMKDFTQNNNSSSKELLEKITKLNVYSLFVVIAIGFFIVGLLFV